MEVVHVERNLSLYTRHLHKRSDLVRPVLSSTHATLSSVQTYTPFPLLAASVDLVLEMALITLSLSIFACKGVMTCCSNDCTTPRSSQSPGETASLAQCPHLFLQLPEVVGDHVAQLAVETVRHDIHRRSDQSQGIP